MSPEITISHDIAQISGRAASYVVLQASVPACMLEAAMGECQQHIFPLINRIFLKEITTCYFIDNITMSESIYRLSKQLGSNM
jgi:hypothetical protein